MSYLDPELSDSTILPLALILVVVFLGRKSVVLLHVKLGEPQRFVAVCPGSHDQHMDHGPRLLGGQQFRQRSTPLVLLLNCSVHPLAPPAKQPFRRFLGYFYEHRN